MNRSFADIKYLDRLMWADTVATSHATQQDTFNLYKPQSNKIKLTLASIFHFGLHVIDILKKVLGGMVLYHFICIRIANHEPILNFIF